MTTDIPPADMPPAVLDWTRRRHPGARLVAAATHPMPTGAVARRIELLTIHLDGGPPVQLVRKDAPAHEVAGLRAAQEVRPHATAVPELVAWGPDWLITPLAPGASPDPAEAVPANLIDTLARLHARYHGAAGLPDLIPRVDPGWWRMLCRDWVMPQLTQLTGAQPQDTITRAQEIVQRATDHPAVDEILHALPTTLLHGDVHTGNILVHHGQAVLVDWGSSRIGPAMLDLATLAAAESPTLAQYTDQYTDAWQRLTDTALPALSIDLGYRWSAVQIPVQYLPWRVQHGSTAQVHEALDRITAGLAALTS